MLLTTLGEFGLFVTQRSADHQRLLGVDGPEARRLLRRFEADPFVFLACDEPQHQDTGRPIAVFGRGFVDIEEMKKTFFWAFFLSVLLIYFLLGGLFESYIQPLAILMSVLLAYIGSSWFMYATGTPWDVAYNAKRSYPQASTTASRSSTNRSSARSDNSQSERPQPRWS